MMKVLMAMLLVLCLAGCTRMPTESTQVADDRPRLSFDPVNIRGKPSSYEVVVDGIAYGTLDQFLVGRHALPIVAGRHQVEVHKDGRVVLNEDVVLGENTTRVIRIIDSD